MRTWLLAMALLAGCGETGPDPDPDPDPSALCEPGKTDDFALGIVIFDNPRWFQKFDDGCETVEMQTGLQGGWHIEPAVQAPRTAVKNDLGGRIIWTVDDEDGNQVADGEFELYRSFWQSLEGGDAYWGDFVIFDRNPTALVGTQLTINCELDFDDESNVDDLTVSQTVEFVDEDPTTVFDQ